ncbi:MAG: molybdopterin molybdotransferase MoeA [Desulfomonilaceae bacterium]|nr:molybdopterin molybdotransferase MoeA [Desulfomonilaceae bacterium]
MNRSPRRMMGFDEALRLALTNVPRLLAESLPTGETLGRVAAEEVRAVVDSPSVDASIKDGYAVISADLVDAGPSRPVELRIAGSVGAGGETPTELVPGTAIRVLSGAPLPQGATAVLADEFAEAHGTFVHACADAHEGRNVLRTGTDVAAGEILVMAGEELTPGKIGLLVAGGVTKVEVVRRPRAGLIATGDEVLLPGRRIEKGKLYASNVALQDAWLRSKGIECEIGACTDAFEDIARALTAMIGTSDVVITSGGAWKGDHDLVVKVLDDLGWEFLFHRVRMGPGKAVGMGILGGKPVFCLPGGPPSNEMAFLMIVLPALLRMAGHTTPAFPELFGRLDRDVTGQVDWTQFVHCDLTRHNRELRLSPLDMNRRLSAISRTRGIVKIPEGVERLEEGTIVPFTPVAID